MLGRYVIRPLAKVRNAVECLAKGEFYINVDCADRADEIGDLSRAVLLLRDASQNRRVIDEAAAAALALKSGYFEHAPIALVVVRNEVIIGCNSAAARLFKSSSSELVGRALESLYFGELAKVHAKEENCRRLEGSETYIDTVQLRRRDGNKFWGELSCGPGMDSYNNCCVWALRDITEVKQREMDQLERCHRLEKLVVDRTRQLEEVRQHSLLGVRAIQVRGGAYRDFPGVVPFDPENAVAGVAAIYAARMAESGRELVLNLPADLPATVLANPLHISQVLGELLRLSIRSEKHGEIVVVVRQVGRDDHTSRLEFSVLSGAWGRLRPESVREMDRLSRDEAEGQGGKTCANLAMVSCAVESMGGTLRIEGQPGLGCNRQFTVDLRLASPVKDKISDYVKQLRRHAGRPVMLIDDSPSALKVAAGMSAVLGFVPVEFDSGTAALASLSRQGAPRYAFICIDYGMPDIDGMEVARRLQMHYGRACPPILLVGMDGKAMDGQGGATYATAVVSKPLTLNRLADAVSDVLSFEVGGHGGAKLPILKGKRILLLCRTDMLSEITVDALHYAGVMVSLATDGVEVLQAVREKAPDCMLLDCRVPLATTQRIIGQLRALGYATFPIIGMALGVASVDRANCIAAGMSDVVENPGNTPELADILARWLARSKPAFPPDESGAPFLPPLPPGLDVATGLRHLRGKTTLFLKALKMFRDNCGQQFLLEFRFAIKAGDWLTSGRLARNLKDTAATIGAKEVSVAAARIEASIRACNYDEANALLPELSEKLSVLIQGLAHIG